jgi:outer membrane immunogenic protein
MKKYLLLAAPALALATPAFAQDGDTRVGGFRVEGIVGGDRIDINEDESDLERGDPRGNIAGAFYGGSIGFDIGTGPAMFGIDAEYTETTADRGIFADVDPTSNVLIREIASVEFGRDLYIGGRATFAVSNSVNFYVKGGYTNFKAAVKLAEDDLQDELEKELGDEDPASTLDGLRGALGFQYSPGGSNTYYGLEGRYSNYESGVDKKQIALVVGLRF